METKQDKIITFISALLAAVILVVVIACNVGNDSSKTDALENQSEKGMVITLQQIYRHL